MRRLSTSARSTGTSLTSIRRSTGVSTRRCGWPTTSSGCTASGTSSMVLGFPFRSLRTVGDRGSGSCAGRFPDRVLRLRRRRGLEFVPPADASIATLWLTAYAVARAQDSKRKFYLVQDFEPRCSTQRARCTRSQRRRTGSTSTGCVDTDNLRRIYHDDYGGKAMSFMPAVDRSVFHAQGRPWRVENGPAHRLRVCAARALAQLLGAGIARASRTEGPSWRWGPHRHGRLVGYRPCGEQRRQAAGLLGCKATGDLSRRCDVGLALTVSKHPSYLPLELMACGVPVVAFDNAWGHWILKDGENSLLARRTVTGVVDALERLCVSRPLREKLAETRSPR